MAVVEEKKVPCMPSKEPEFREESGMPATTVANGLLLKRISVKKRTWG